MSGYSIFNRQRFSKYLCCVGCALLMILATGCGDKPSNPETTEQVTTDSTATGSAVLSIQWHRASTDSYTTSAPVRQAIEDCAGIGVASITCEVYDENNNPIASGGPWRCEDGQGRIDRIPIGINRTFTVLGWDTEGGNIVYQGQTTSGIDIKPREIADAGEIMAYPFVPTGLAATTSSSSRINLAWNDFIEEFEVEGYRIYRDGASIATSDASSYQDSDLSADTRYCYTVAAYDVFGNESGPSNEACATTNPSDDDVDNDGDGYSQIQGDCNDADANVNPGAAEICGDGIDQDCNGADLSCDGVDNDGDGYSEIQGDCNDADASVNPGAAEVCNGVDDNCAGGIDEGLSTDADGDGHYTPGSCFTPADDCDDADASVHPNATESCNEVDDNCNGSTDEGVLNTYYRDSDEDRYGDASRTTQACSAPSGYVSNSTDCDDSDASVHPNAAETCNEVDDDCDGFVDEGVQNTYYRDSDRDGYGDENNTTEACTEPSGYVTNSTDCNDLNRFINPEADEICNDRTDNDCDGLTDIEDEECTCTYSVTIGDNDGYGFSPLVADGANLPDSNGWIFENRAPSEMNATDGSEHTDQEPSEPRDFTFTITFCPADRQSFNYATFTLDVSGIQASSFGASTLLLDDNDYSQYLNQEQGIYGSDIIRINIEEVSLFTDGVLRVRFIGGISDAIAFDYFSLDTDN